MDFTQALRQLMQAVGISNFRTLGEIAQVSRRTVDRLRQGDGYRLKYADLSKLAAVLEISVADLIHRFIEVQTDGKEESETVVLLRECRRLQDLLQQQEQELRSQFIRDAVQCLESLLLQLPSVVYAAQQNPQLTAKNILPLFRSLDLLLQQWGVVTIAQVGMEVPFNACQHELMEVEPSSIEIVEGSPVVVRYVGYMLGDKLLHRARVVPSILNGVSMESNV
jgi:DNA-binding Xre family transcriptional regulator